MYMDFDIFEQVVWHTISCMLHAGEKSGKIP